MKRVDSQNKIDKAKYLASNGFSICLTLIIILTYTNERPI